MLQLLQSLKDGTTELLEVPLPRAGATSVVIQTAASVISAGTERMLVDFGRSNWIEKARSQPDKVRQVLDKVRTDGIGPTLGAVRAKLDAPIPLGYCNAGVVVDVGSRVEGFAVGDRVVSNGPHAEFVRVPRTLVARIPESVSMEAAAFTPLISIALQGVRLAAPQLGETVVVYGLGLVGLLTVQLVQASGCRVIGIDRDRSRLALAEQMGALTVAAREGVDVVNSVLELTGHVGADAVLLTLATDSDEPVHYAAAMSRKRGRLVLVGVTGLKLRRDDFYKKELTFQVSCSYGPGRHDPQYEDNGIDYPLPFVRWTEGRNFEASLRLMAEGRLDPLPLISHRFPLSDAPRAYDVVAGSEPSLAIVLSYPERGMPQGPPQAIQLTDRDAATSAGRIGWIGAGNFASRILIPAFADAGADLHTIASSGGTSAAVSGRRAGFRTAVSDGQLVIDDPAVDTVVIATRHDTHADWVVRSLSAGKHVFVEKPLSLTLADIDRIERAAQDSRRLLCVGFNRRRAPHVVRLREALTERVAPVTLLITVNAGRLPREHWTHDRATGGGRIVGEGCHFVDLARSLVGSPIHSIRVTTARGADAAAIEDIASMTIAFRDGSTATILYLSNGHPSFPKERIEAFWEGNVVQLDNYRRVRAWGPLVQPTRWPDRQDKGHRALAHAFLSAVRGSAPAPIPLQEILEVSRWSVRAAELAAVGGGEAHG